MAVILVVLTLVYLVPMCLIFYRMIAYELVLYELLERGNPWARLDMPGAEDFLFKYWNLWSVSTWAKYVEENKPGRAF